MPNNVCRNCYDSWNHSFQCFYYNSKKLSLYGFALVHSLICRFYILGVLYTKVFNIWRLTVMDVFDTVKNFFIKEELNQYVEHFNKTELKTVNNNSL